jgi:hypothetical protein
VWRCGNRTLSDGEIEEIGETIRVCGRLSRTELAGTLCEHLGWYSASGGYRLTACLKLMDRLAAEGLVRLPAKRVWRHSQAKLVLAETADRERDEVVAGTIGETGPIELVLVTSLAERKRWEAEMNRYHPLGYKKPFGCQLRYEVKSGDQIWGCLLFSGAAKAIKSRDLWVGWTQEQRMRNLGWVINNSRFVIFPHIRVKNLASHVLGRLFHRLPEDWYRQWGYHPLLMETFIDPVTHQGSCYKAANWEYVGMTTGRG